jgi:aminoglycoside phosphotransferase (APT) family kinase protein
VIETFLDRKASVTPDMMTEDNPFLKGFLAMYREFIESLRSFGDCDVYADKIAAWDKQKLLGSWIIVAEPMRSGFTVLTHGDFWLNNMLFKGDEVSEPSDVSLIDFQGNTWAGPALDLHYFIVSSVNDDIKVDRFDEFIKWYHEALVESLTKLKFDQHIPTLDELYTDLMDKAHTGMRTNDDAAV